MPNSTPDIEQTISKMKIKLFPGFFLIMTGVFLVVYHGCRKDETIVWDKVTGLVQKGPFINGTNIVLYELNSSLGQTGKTFTTMITNNYGSFEIKNVNLGSPYALLVATGYYYDEARGTLSGSPLTLQAVCDVSDASTVNINILTHLEKPRIEYLARSMAFKDAKKQAQTELLSIFGFTSEIDPAESLDISKDSESNAALLAVTVIIQGIRNTALLTEFLSTIATDFGNDGRLNESTLSELRNTMLLSANLPLLRSRLIARYNEIGQPATIPLFEEYVGKFLAYTGTKPYAFVKQATAITVNGATLQGLVNANDLSAAVSFEYGTDTTYGHVVSAYPATVTGHSLTPVSATISNLGPLTVCHYRVKAVNSRGTALSRDLILSRTGLLTDIDGNTYPTVLIDRQEWMAENLKVTKYQDGTEIPLVTDINTWNLLTTGALCEYNNDPEKVKVYGRLYNYLAVINTRKICPAGWHVPSDEEWNTLSNYLVSNGYGYGGSGTDIAKSLASESGWLPYSLTGCTGNDMMTNNTTGFNALPGGFRNLQGLFYSIENIGTWYSKTPVNDADAWFRLLNYNYTEFGRVQNKKTCGASLRCVKD
jgi:uncharacterized protein (TIGR02145 family)